MRCPRSLPAATLHLQLLAQSARHGDQRQRDALATALLRYLDRAVTRSLRQRGVDACHVDDLVQDTCIRILEELPSWDPARGAFHTWISYRVKWSVGDRLRQMFRSPLIDPDTIELADAHSTEDRLANDLHERALLGLRQAVQQLPVRERDCLEATLAGDKLRVMAGRLGMNASSVCRLRQQAVSRLGELLAA
jgi:RNA polymerase sigma factor (sigma-70 family)